MRDKRFSIGLEAALTILFLILSVTSTWAAPKEKVLHSFNNGKEGYHPYAGVIFDASGNLYGTTAHGGCNDPYSCGTVFELTPTAGEKWKEKVLHRFQMKDGAIPYAGLIFDAAGNLYGTTDTGGGFDDAGVVFELMPAADGAWKEKILHRFNVYDKDGYYPRSGVIFDTAGNLYGTTAGGGSYFECCGTVFELTPKAGSWAEKVLHTFTNKGKDGYEPSAGLIVGASGNIYGTTTSGGAYGCGTVFELTPKAGGGWTEKVLHSFKISSNDCLSPNASVIFGASGSLYGTTYEGGAHGYGTVFELVPRASGGWTEKVLHSFGNGKDGSYPNGIVFGASGELYGATSSGGDFNQCTYGCGTLFELTPKAGGGWAERVLHSFGKGKDGSYPNGGLVFDSNGNLYGTTSWGGAYGYGTVFEITPPSPVPSN